MISRCSSPIPEISVWPVSRSRLTRKDGSSLASLVQRLPSFSWSALVLGSIAMWMTGSGNSIDSSTIGCARSQSVSPVVVSRRPTAQMSPAKTSVISSRLLACILTSRPIRSRLRLVELSTDDAALERARVDAQESQRADVRIGHDLERERSERRVVARPALFHLVADLAHHRRNVERRRQIVDHRIEHRLHALVAERRAHSTGIASILMRAPCGRRAQISGVGDSLPSRYFSMMRSSWSASVSIIFSRQARALSLSSAGISSTRTSRPSVLVPDERLLGPDRLRR